MVNQKNYKENEQVTSNDIYNVLDLRKKNFKTSITNNTITITENLDIKHKKTKKKFAFTFNKRQIDENDFQTYPWGYQF